MGRRLIALISGFIILLTFFTPRSFAQEGQMIDPAGPGVAYPDITLPPPEPRPGFLGQDHSYSVVFRGNGEAVISLKVVVTNKADADLSEASLRVPKVEPKNVSVYQVIREPRCTRYGPSVYDPETRSYQQGECLNYQEPDFYTYYGQSKYQKAKHEYTGDTLTVTLPQPIKPNASGSYFVYYRAFGYADKNIFGAYKYTFASAKVDDEIRSLQVGIATDSDLVLRGVKGEVQYRFEEAPVGAFGEAGVAAPEANVLFDRFYTNIGQGRITKTASNLAPLESYTVDGSYAADRLKLYAREIITAGVAGLALLALFVVIVRFALKKLRESAKGAKTQKAKEGKLSENTRLSLAAAGIGFASAILIVSYTALVILGASLVSSLIRYNLQAVFTIFLLIISFAIYTVLLFGPAIYIGVKKGAGWAIAVVISTVLWLIVFSALALFIIFLVAQQGYPGPIVPLLQGISG